MKRDSFVFYSSWMDAVNVLPEEMQADLLATIVLYGIQGEMPEQPSPIAQAILAMVKPQIDLNNRRYKRGRKGGEFGYLGGRPRKHLVNNGEVSETPNVNVNDNENVFKIESTNVDKKEAEASSLSLNQDYIKFKEWIKQKAPYCASPKNFPSSQITEAEFLKLKKLYTGQQIAEVIEQIENRKDLRRKYVNLYRTVLNWAKKQYGMRADIMKM